ncbi:HNH endonuclease [Macrococcoides caseolyticum]|uniref:Uncharacterized protein n=1 Tax=Macrococcoides caseolyticum TaxID=69966 RepID=A0ACC9MTI7_9STAP|nr:HNH endonuclease [Macrococcus caseolyticus]PKE39175.1 hypothetical protein CW675_07990 [Macrococcus caseolyticus]PKE56221.1 hypothetical protein CW682_08270 [Macrococcus caseolyticus]
MDPNIRALLLNRFISLKGIEITEFKKTFSNIEFSEYLGEKYHMISAGGRGIYKPKNSPYALSIRCDMTDNPYDDDIYFDENGNFEKLIYHGPTSQKLHNRAKNDIDSLISCYEDKIPFGIIYTLGKKKSYRSLGLGIIKSHNNNMYEIIPYNLIDDLHKDDISINEDDLNSIEEIHYNKITEKKYNLKVRLAQSEFRNNLLSKHSKCLLCDIDFKPILIASHIKPWSECSDSERLDINNGFLLCPLHDKLFDKGLISFNEDTLVISDKIKNKDFFKSNSKKIYNFNNEQKSFLSYHKNNIFKND